MLPEHNQCLQYFSKEILEPSNYCFNMLEVVKPLHTLGKCSPKPRVLSHSSSFLTLRLIWILEVLQNKLRSSLKLCWVKDCLKTFSGFCLNFVRAERSKCFIPGISFPSSIMVLSPSQLNKFQLSFKTGLKLFHSILTVGNSLSRGFALVLFLVN